MLSVRKSQPGYLIEKVETVVSASPASTQSYNSSVPFFSVILPTHNRADLLPRAIQSILSQTLGDFELIVIDDGSTDSTGALVAGYHDQRIRYIYQDQRGQAHACNLGAKVAQAPYITFMDSDDEALPDWLELFASGCREPEVGIVSGGAIEIVERDGTIVDQQVRLPQNAGPLYCNQTVMIMPGTWAVRRHLFEDVGGYKPKPSRIQRDLAIRIIPHCLEQGFGIKSLQVPVARWFRHEGSRITRDPLAQYQGAMGMLDDYGDLMLARDPRRYGIYCCIAGVNAFRLGRCREARTLLWNAVRHYPWYWKFHGRLVLSLFPPLARVFWPVYRDA